MPTGQQSSTPTPRARAHDMHGADTAFAQAARLHDSGRIAEAEKLCCQALTLNPDHASSLHLLGIIAHQAGDRDRATELMTRAAEANDSEPIFHNNLGNVLADAGRLRDACARYERALALKPNYAEALYNLGNVSAALGDFDQALAVYRRALALKPNYAEAHNNLGNLLHRLKRVDDAQAQFRAAIAARPDMAEAHNNLGNLLNDQGRYKEASALFERAIALNPRYPDAHNNLGLALLALGAVTEAIGCFQAAVALRPRYINALNNLGNAFADTGQWEEARARYQRALAFDPDSAETLYNLGNVSTAFQDFEAAVADYDKAIALKSDYAEAHCNRGYALAGLDRHDEAMAAYNRALAINPKLAAAYCSMGSVLVEHGRIDEALKMIEQAIALEPNRPKFHLFHILAKPASADDPRIPMLRALARTSAAMPAEDRVHLHFALAKAYSDVGRHHDAFVELQTGNALKRKQVDYDEDKTLAHFRSIAAAASHEVIGRWRGLGNPSDRPVFIVGMPRSGSTLVEQILASHPEVAGGGELAAFQNAAAAALGTSDKFLPVEGPGENGAALLARIAGAYLAALDAIGPGAQRVTDKMPVNFAFVGLIHLALPNARIVHTRRAVLDTCLSCYGTLFAGGLPFTYDLGEIGRYWRGYDALMRHWRDVLPPAAILDVNYETLVADFEAEARRIVAYCGLPWSDSCLSFYATRRPVKTASAIQVRQPLYKNAIGRWRGLDPELLKPLLAALGEPAGSIQRA